MAAPERADDEREREAGETTGVRPDESGARLRTHAAIEEDEEEELELVEVVVEPRRRAAAIPPPPPRRAHHPERFDLDELLRDVARSSALGPPVVPPLDIEPPAAPSVQPARSRPQYGIAIVVGTTGLIAGAIAAFVLAAPKSAEPAAAPAEATEPEIVPAEIAEAIAPAPEPAALPEIPPPVAIAPEPEPEQLEAAPPAPLARPRVRRSAAVAAEAEAPATEEAASAEAAAEETASEAADTVAEAVATEESVEATEASVQATEASASALPERPAREDVDAAVAGIMPALRACGQGLDLITLELHFASSGRATTATTHARHLTPEQRSCVARAARTARVPPFSAPHLSVHYPVRL